MPSLANHSSNQFTKLLLVGDSGSGKTGSMASLALAGYKLRVLDFDNGLEPLKNFIAKENPQALANVEYRTLRDEFKMGSQGPEVVRPKAWVTATKMLEKWTYEEDDGTKVDLGDPSEWGPDCILVVDSLTLASQCAYNWAKLLTPAGKSGDQDGRAIFLTAQQSVEKFLAAITSEAYETNVLVLSHIRYAENDEGKQKGYPSAVGAALGPAIPRYFNNFLRFQTKGNDRTIMTEATSLMDLKTSKPFALAKSYPIETGLADIFAVLREQPEVKPAKEKSLRRA